MVLTSLLRFKTSRNTPFEAHRSARPVTARALSAVVAAALALATFSLPARADEPPPLTPDTLFHKAGKAYDAGEYAAAHALYEQVFATRKTHDVAAMLAQTEMKLDRPCEAAEHLAFALEAFPPSLADDRRARIVRAQAEVAKRVGTLAIDARPADASVRVDFTAVPTARLPGPFCVPAGDRVVFVERAGFAVERHPITVAPGAAVELTIELRRLPIGPLPSSSFASSSLPSDLLATSGPLAPRALAPLQPMDPRMPLFLTLLSAGVGGLVAGAIVLPLAQLKHDEADRLSRHIAASGGACSLPTDFAPECRRLQSLRTDASSFGNAGLASLVTGAVLGAAGGGLLLLRPPDTGTRPGGPHVTLGAAPGGAHAALTGFF